MLITKFNRMIRNRFVWATFAILVSLFFLLSSDEISRGCSAQNEEKAGVGTLFQKPVMSHEFALAKLFELGFRSEGSMSREGQKRLRERTWKRLAAVRAAHQMGLAVTDEEVATTIHNDPSFAENGVFNRERYAQIVERQLGTDLITFENYVRQELLLRKLTAVFGACSWMSPAEIEERSRNLTDTVQADYVVLSGQTLVPKVKVDDETISRVFAEQKERFKRPEKASVLYVTFPISNYLAKIEIPDDEITDYYEDHLSDFQLPAGTNETAEPAPLETVRDQIVRRLIDREASFRARDAADDFVISMTPPPYGKGLTLVAAAKTSGLAVATTAFFSVQEEVPGISAGQDFNEAAFDLDADDPERCFSDAILGSNAAYVVASHQREAARIPELDEVRSQVKEVAESEAKERAFEEKTREIRQSIQTALNAGQSFMQAAKGLGLNVVTTAPFSAYGAMTEEFNDSKIIVPATMNLQAGELSEIVSTGSNALLVHVAQRLPGDAISVQFIKPQLINSIDQYRSSIVFESWLDYILVKAGWQDHNPLSDITTDESADEADDEETDKPAEDDRDSDL